MCNKILLTLILSFSPMFLQAGDAASGKAISGACASCHGTNGLSGNDAYPSIAGQKETYLVKTMKAYQTGQRVDTNMQAQVGPLTAKNIEDLAAYFASNITSNSPFSDNNSIPSYSLETRILSLPVVKVLTDLYRVEMLQISDSQFELKSVDKVLMSQ